MEPIFKKNTLGYKVLTPAGFQPFAGVSLMNITRVMKLSFENNIWIKCTEDHKFYRTETETITADELKIGDTIQSTDGPIRLILKEFDPTPVPVYDLIEVENGHRYYTNKLLSSNCEFLVYDETLINSLMLSELEGKEPIMKMGQCRWYKQPTDDMLYLVSLDPSLGTGGNNAAIQVFEMPSMIQVAEWCHNSTPIEGQIKILRDICRYIADTCPRANAGNIYWTVENNTVGEAALITIKNLGEENIPGLLVSEPIRKGHVRKFRKGFNTTHKAKITACARLKHMVETKKMTINSKALISELKAYIAAGITFNAKPGETDDLVAATLLTMRLSSVLADWDQRVFDVMTASGIEDVDDDWEPPMPIFVSATL